MRLIKIRSLSHIFRSRAFRVPVAALALLAVPVAGRAVTCTTQGSMASADRDALAIVGENLSTAIAQQNDSVLQSSLLPSVAQQWPSIQNAADSGTAMLKGGKIQLRNLYILDATSLTAPTDTQFFCSSANGSMTVTFSMHALPPGKYAIVLADAVGAPLAGQIALVLGWDANAWKLGGVFVRPGMLGGHDGVYYWQRAREAARSNAPWAAYYAYEAARSLLIPIEFISTPNLDKLNQEQSQIADAPKFPYTVQSGDRTFTIDSVHFDDSIGQPDLGVVYQSTGVTDPAAQRTEAIAALSAFLKAQPVLRSSFHGLWAYSSSNGKVSAVLELPMNQIP